MEGADAPIVLDQSNDRTPVRCAFLVRNDTGLE